MARREFEQLKEEHELFAGNLHQRTFALRDLIEELREELMELRQENALNRDEIAELRTEHTKFVESKVCRVM
jgi:cell division protein FtsB